MFHVEHSGKPSPALRQAHPGGRAGVGRRLRRGRAPLQRLDGDQLWVQLVGRGESPFRVRSGQRASFTGRLVPNPPGFALWVGMVPSEGAALAQRQGHHIEVAYADITLEP